jgi:MAF protein
MKLVLASSSLYRRELLGKLAIPFETGTPDIDETPYPGELPNALVSRLSAEKAAALQSAYPDSLIVGSDQIATLDNTLLTKPGSLEKAKKMLLACSGRQVNFITGLSLLNTTTGRCKTVVEEFQVYFRSLSEREISRYLEKELPLDCAGSFKVEGLGICLFEKLQGNDPNALIGLPLIRLVDLLKAEGLSPL